MSKVIRISLFSLFLSISIAVYSQVQQGNVKTLGRPNQKGMALAGVTIRVKGIHNAILSKADGAFGMHIQGQTYSLQQVQKQGYELLESSIIGRQYAYSSSVPLTIVMVSQKQLQEDIIRIENNAYNTAERNYKQKMSTLEAQKSKNKITIQQYQQQIHDLQDKFEKYQSLIAAVSEHYARTDYDNLDEEEKAINCCIENGELEKADSLMRQNAYIQRLNNLLNNQSRGLKLSQSASDDMAAIIKQQEKDAEYLYQLYTIALARFDNEKARFYILTRAELDSTVFKWQKDAYEFLCEYQADYDEAEKYSNRSLALAKLDKEGNVLHKAESYNMVGTIWYYKGNLDAAQEMYEKSHEILSVNLEEPHEVTVETYACLGNVFSSRSVKDFQASAFTQAAIDRTSMFKYYEKALNICESIPNTSNDMKASCYYCMAMACTIEGENNNFQNDKRDTFINFMSKAQSYYGKAVEEWSKGKIYQGKIATCYLSMSQISYAQLDFTTTIEKIDSAYNLFKKVYGESHPMIAYCWNNIGSVYSSQDNDSLALSYYSKAYELRKTILGEGHPQTQNSFREVNRILNKMGGSLPDSLYHETIFKEYYQTKDYKKALESFTKAIRFLKKDSVANHHNLILTYETKALVEKWENEYDAAINDYESALSLRSERSEAESMETAVIYMWIGTMYFSLHDYQKAFKNLNKSYYIHKNIESEPNLETSNVLEWLGKVQIMLKNYPRAIRYLEETLKIRKEILEESDPDVQEIKLLIEQINVKLNTN